MGARQRNVWRLAAGAAVLALAASAALESSSFVLQSRDPALALRLNPSNPVAIVREARHALTIGQTGKDGGSLALDAAKRSIREQPLNAPAFRLYGLVRAANADLDAIGDQIAMSDRLSRRDLGAQLFLIEDAVRRNDIAGALHHYDTALRVDSSVRTLLFPVLTSAMSEPLIRNRFRPYLAAPPPWLESFLRNAISTSTNPSSLAALAIETGGFPKGDEYGSLHTELMVALESAGQFSQLVRYYRSLPDAPQSLLTSLAFTGAGTDRALAPVSWLPYVADGIDSTFVSNSNGGLELETAIDQGFAGTILRKLTALPPGTYALSAPMRADNYSQGDTVRWHVNCPGKNGASDLLNSSVAVTTRFEAAGRFTVPPGCPMQRFEVIANTAYGTSTLKVTFASPKLTRQ